MLKFDTTKSIEDLLYERKLINSDQLSAIKFEHVNTGKEITQIVKERGYVSDEDFVKAFGDVYGIEYVNLTGKQIPAELVEL
ncbi:MAG: hypothetical protein ACD_24C00032G0003, partial [uncultured bacterium]